MLHIIVPKMIVGIMYIITPKLFGTATTKIPTIRIEAIIESNVAIPVEIIVYDSRSIYFNFFSAMLSPKTSFWNHLSIHQ